MKQLLVAFLIYVCALCTAQAEPTRGPWSEKQFLDLLLNRPATEAVAALGEPQARTDGGNGMQMWVYRDLVLKPKRETTFPVTQLVVTGGRVVQIGHSDRAPAAP